MLRALLVRELRDSRNNIVLATSAVSLAYLRPDQQPYW